MNIESKFGLKDSFATAAILAAMLVFILAGIVTHVDAHTARRDDGMRNAVNQSALNQSAAKASQAGTEVQKLPPIIITASRRLPIADVAAANAARNRGF